MPREPLPPAGSLPSGFRVPRAERMALRESEAFWSGFSLDLGRVVIWIVPATRQPFGHENTTRPGEHTDICTSIHMYSCVCYDPSEHRGSAWAAEVATNSPSEKRINKS